MASNGNLLFATPILSDAAVLTGSPTQSAAPVTQLQTMPPTDVCVFLNLAAYLEWDFGSAKSINLVALLATNAESGATWRIRAADTQAGLTSAPAYDSGVMSCWDGFDFSTWDTVDLLHWIPAGYSRRWGRLDITHATAPPRAGRWYAANAWQPARNYQYGATPVGFDDVSPTTRTAGNNRVIRRLPPERVLEFSLRFLDAATDLRFGVDLDRLRGASRDLLVCLDPDNTTGLRPLFTAYGTLDAGARWGEADLNAWERNYIMRELL